MDRLEQTLRDELTRRVAAPPYVPNLADTVVRRGRRVKQRRVLAAAGAAVAVVAVVLASTSVLPSADDRGERFAGVPLEGPPRVPLFVDQSGELVEWVDGEQRIRGLRDMTPVARVPSGLLVVGGAEGQMSVGVLSSDPAEARPLLAQLAYPAVAVSDDGGRVVVVTAGPGRQLQELAVPSGRVLRTVILAGPVFPDDELVLPVAYSGDAVLLTAGEGRRQRAYLWEAGDEHVVGQLDGFRSVLGGADADFSGDRGAIGGRGAFTVDDDSCRVEVHQLRNRGGNPWRLCGEDFVGFSADGEHVLATGEGLTAVVVRDADSGDVRRSFQVTGGVSAAGWESDDTLLYTSVQDGGTVVVRCSVSRDACTQAASFDGTDRIPQPVRSVG